MCVAANAAVCRSGTDCLHISVENNACPFERRECSLLLSVIVNSKFCLPLSSVYGVNTHIM